MDLADQFGSRVDITVDDRPDFMFTPADKNSEGNANPDEHLGCYKIPGFKADRNVLIENQFGTQTLKVKDGMLLCAPSALAEAPHIPSPPADPLVGSFQCYSVDQKHSTRLAIKPVVQLEGRFGFVAGVVVEDRPELLCNPVDVNGQGIVSADDHLACYQIKGFKANRDVVIANAFGDQELRLKDGKLLCVPSTKTEL